MKLSYLILPLFALISHPYTTAYEEVKVLSPATLAAQFDKGIINDSPALFGVPDYQTIMRGQVLWAVDKDSPCMLYI